MCVSQCLCESVYACVGIRCLSVCFVSQVCEGGEAGKLRNCYCCVAPENQSVSSTKTST